MQRAESGAESAQQRQADERGRARVQRPVFLVGAPRSGTTLVALMFDHHPQITWCGEVHYIVDFLPDRGLPAVAAYREWLERDRIFRMARLQVDPALDYPALVDSFLAQRRQVTGKPVVGGTLHRRFDRVLEVWPDARFIHLVRDGRDVASSCIGMGWAGNTWTGATRWLRAELAWDALRPRLDPACYLELSYEELIQVPRDSLSAVCAFLGVPYDPAMLSYPQDTSYGAPDPRLTEQWRRRDPEEVRLAEARLGELLRARGYQPSGHPPLEVGPLDELRLRGQDRLARFRFRLDRYGPLLWAGETVTRRLGLEPLHRPLLRRVHEVDTRLLK